MPIPRIVKTRNMRVTMTLIDPFRPPGPPSADGGEAGVLREETKLIGFLLVRSEAESDPGQVPRPVVREKESSGVFKQGLGGAGIDLTADDRILSVEEERCCLNGDEAGRFSRIGILGRD